MVALPAVHQRQLLAPQPPGRCSESSPAALLRKASFSSARTCAQLPAVGLGQACWCQRTSPRQAQDTDGPGSGALTLPPHFPWIWGSWKSVCACLKQRAAGMVITEQQFSGWYTGACAEEFNATWKLSLRTCG